VIRHFKGGSVWKNAKWKGSKRLAGGGRGGGGGGLKLEEEERRNELTNPTTGRAPEIKRCYELQNKEKKNLTQMKGKKKHVGWT